MTGGRQAERGRAECTEELRMENLSFTEFGEYKVQIQSLIAIITF